MHREQIDLLVTFDKNYIEPFRVMLKSLSISNPRETFRIWLLHSAIPDGELRALAGYCAAHRMTLTPVQVDPSIFENAPVSRRYPKEMYYRLLAPILLPEELERVLYLDPDILVINPIRPLWETRLGEAVFAAASHSGIFEFINGVNRVRLKEDHDYFNTGVLLMDLARAREVVSPTDIFQCVCDQAELLVLPDQDVFNLLYGARTLQVDDNIWNYDTRYYSAYRLRSEGKCDIGWVMENTVFLHFCGKQKPWRAKSFHRFSMLYKHYMNLVQSEDRG